MKKLVLFIVFIVLFINYSLPVYAEEEILSEEMPSEEIVDEDKVEEEKDAIPEEIVEEEVIEDIEENTEEIVEEETLVEETPIEEEIIIEEIVEEVEVVKETAKATSTNETPKTVSKYAKIKNTEASINGFVVRLYRNVLNREPDDGGFGYWTKGIKNKSITGSTAVKGFFLSKEITNKNISNEDFVKLLYLTILNRNADKGGLKYWVDQLNVKMTREYVVNGFINSKEFGDLCNKYGVNRGTSSATKYYRDKSYNVTAFVSRMYTKALGRQAEINGLEYWCKNLIDKTDTGASIVKGFFQSKEFENKNISDDEFLNLAYQVIMDRNSDSAGLNYWKNKLNSHYSRSYILKGFVESKEFNGLCAKYGISVGRYESYDLFKTVNAKKVSYLSQDDKRWGRTKYGGYTIGSTGCAEVAMAMAFSGELGKTILPTTIADYLYNHTNEFNKGKGVGTTGTGIKLAGDYYGLTVVPLKSRYELESALKSGHIVVANMNPGIFCNRGATHAITLNGYSGGSTYAYDPKNVGRNGWYNINTVFSQGSTAGMDYYDGAVFFMICK